MISRVTFSGPLVLAVAAILQPASASAELVLSQLIVDLQSGRHVREDVEIWNNSPERAYVAVQPSEIADAGLDGERRLDERDPGKLGLLVSPARMILEPGQRKLVRIAAIAPPAERERVYRVTVKPVAGELDAQESGLKILVGYDVLVLVRPIDPNPAVTGVRNGNLLTIQNHGNVSVELTDGRQCGTSGRDCSALPGKRLYPGARWSQQLGTSAPAQYIVKSSLGSVRKSF